MGPMRVSAFSVVCYLDGCRAAMSELAARTESRCICRLHHALESTAFARVAVLAAALTAWSRASTGRRDAAPIGAAAFLLFPWHSPATPTWAARSNARAML